MASNRKETQKQPFLSKKRQKEIASLRLKKYRDRAQQFVVEGIRSVASAIEAQAPILEVVCTEAALQRSEASRLVSSGTLPTFFVAERDFARLSDVQASQGVLAVVEQQWEPLESLRKRQSVLVLDGVQDPGNVGTLLRTAAWFGIEAVVAGPGTADVYNPKVVRSAMGGLWDVRLAKADDLVQTLRTLQGDGWQVYGADLRGTALRHWQPQAPSVLVMGSEAHGLHTMVRDLLSEAITIPGNPSRQGAESLNVAVAGGILMERWVRR